MTECLSANIARRSRFHNLTLSFTTQTNLLRSSYVKSRFAGLSTMTDEQPHRPVNHGDCHHSHKSRRNGRKSVAMKTDELFTLIELFHSF